MQAERNRCPPCAAKAMATTSRPTASPVKLVSHPASERHMPTHDDGAHAVRWQPDQGSTTARPDLTKFYRLMKMHGMSGEPADEGQQQDENNSLMAVEDAFGTDVDYAMLQKIYGKPLDDDKRYSPAQCIG